MADFAAPPLVASPPQVPAANIAAPVPVSAAVPAPQEPQEQEHATETLYIQNLNEKIKIPGKRYILYN